MRAIFAAAVKCRIGALGGARGTAAHPPKNLCPAMSESELAALCSLLEAKGSRSAV
jgi:hypothetical protein